MIFESRFGRGEGRSRIVFGGTVSVEILGRRVFIVLRRVRESRSYGRGGMGWVVMSFGVRVKTL